MENTRTFLVDEKMITYEHVRLRMSSVDIFATVFINNIKVGSTSNAFCAYAFEVRKHLRSGVNTIVIIFESAVDVSTRMAQKLPFPIPSTYNFPNIYAKLIQTPYENHTVMAAGTGE